MKYEVICICGQNQRRATLQPVNGGKPFNVFLFPHEANNGKENIVDAIPATADFSDAPSDKSPFLLQEENNALLSAWQIGFYVED